MACFIIGFSLVSLAALMWALVYGDDRRRWDPEYRKAEDDKQAETLAELLRKTKTMKCL